MVVGLVSFNNLPETMRKGLELRAVEIDEAVPIETLAVFSLFNLRLVSTNADEK